jgi:hypothetical protein
VRSLRLKLYPNRRCVYAVCFVIWKILEQNLLYSFMMCGPGSVVGIATGYGLDSPGIESQWARDFPHLSRPAPGPTQSPAQWVQDFSQR